MHANIVVHCTSVRIHPHGIASMLSYRLAHNNSSYITSFCLHQCAFRTADWNLFYIYYLRNTRINFNRFHLPISFGSSPSACTNTTHTHTAKCVARMVAAHRGHKPPPFDAFKRIFTKTRPNNICFRIVAIPFFSLALLASSGWFHLPNSICLCDSR